MHKNTCEGHGSELIYRLWQGGRACLRCCRFTFFSLHLDVNYRAEQKDKRCRLQDHFLRLSNGNTKQKISKDRSRCQAATLNAYFREKGITVLPCTHRPAPRLQAGWRPACPGYSGSVLTGS